MSTKENEREMQERGYLSKMFFVRDLKDVEFLFTQLKLHPIIKNMNYDIADLEESYNDVDDLKELKRLMNVCINRIELMEKTMSKYIGIEYNYYEHTEGDEEDYSFEEQ